MGEEVSASITIPSGERTEQEMRRQWNRADQEMSRVLFHRGMEPVGPFTHTPIVDSVTGEIHLWVRGWAVVNGDRSTWAVSSELI